MKKQTYKKIEVTVIAQAKEDVICASGEIPNPGTVLIPDWN